MIDVPVQTRHDHHGKFQPFGLMDGQQPDRSTRALGREPFFDKGPFSFFRRFIHPLPHLTNDFPKRQPGPRSQFEHDVPEFEHVCQGMFAVEGGCCQFRQGQCLEHVPDGLRNRKRLYLRSQRTQDRKNRWQVGEGRLVRPIIRESPLHDRLDLEVGTAAIRRPQHPHRAKFITGIHQDVQHVAAIDHFLTFIKVFFSFGETRQVVPPKGFEGDSQVGERSKQDRNVARLDRHCATTQEQRFFLQNFLA